MELPARCRQDSEALRILSQSMDAIEQTLIVSRTDPDGIITYANDLFCRSSGYTREELIGQSHQIVRHPDTPDAVIETLWQTILAGRIWRGELKNRRKDGKVYYVDATIYPIRDDAGRVLEYMAIRQDVTERVLAERQVEQEQQFAQMLLDNQESIVATFSEADGVLRANRRFFESFDFDDLEDFRTHHRCICELFIEKEGYVSPSTDDAHWVQDVLEHPEQPHHVLIHDRQGDERVFSTAARPVAFGNNAFFIVTLTDITELEQARQRAERSEQTKGNFMANMSHEIRTPMNGIIGFTQMLTKSGLNLRQAQIVSLIERSTHTLLEIVNDILDFSRIESGNLQLDPGPTSPYIDLYDSVMIFAARARQKSINYHVSMDARIAECLMMDKLRITQILTNLINNAVKFTAEGGSIRVNVQVLSEDTEVQQLRFSVEDTGIGIEPEKLETIFIPFTQADAGTTRQFGGTGLGLSISSSLCAMMQGSLQAQSSPGKGSIFYFDATFPICASFEPLAERIGFGPIRVTVSDRPGYAGVCRELERFGIPYERVDAETATREGGLTIFFDVALAGSLQDRYMILIDPHGDLRLLHNVIHIRDLEACPTELYRTIAEFAARDAAPQQAQIRHHYDLRVLVAEDYDVNRILVDELLREYGIGADFAVDGREAVAKGGSRKYDLILMDINMPEMNGMDATRKLREQGIKTPIVALTANALDGDRERFLACGMDDYVSKPIDPAAIEQILDTYATRAPIIAEQPDHTVNEAVAILRNVAQQMHFRPEVIQRIFGKFVESSRQSAQTLCVAAKSGDLQTLKERAHAIRGIAMTLEFEEIGKICEILEKGAKDQAAMDFVAMCESLRKQITTLSENQKTIMRLLEG